MPVPPDCEAPRSKMRSRSSAGDAGAGVGHRDPWRRGASARHVDAHRTAPCRSALSSSTSRTWPDGAARRAHEHVLVGDHLELASGAGERRPPELRVVVGHAADVDRGGRARAGLTGVRQQIGDRRLEPVGLAQRGLELPSRGPRRRRVRPPPRGAGAARSAGSAADGRRWPRTRARAPRARRSARRSSRAPARSRRSPARRSGRRAPRSRRRPSCAERRAIASSGRASRRACRAASATAVEHAAQAQRRDQQPRPVDPRIELPDRRLGDHRRRRAPRPRAPRSTSPCDRRPG